MGDKHRYTVTIRKLYADSDRERVFCVIADSESAARTAAARQMFGWRASFRGDLPGVPHIGQLWWDAGFGRASGALTGRVSARVEDGW